MEYMPLISETFTAREKAHSITENKNLLKTAKPEVEKDEVL
jgi:hypothetical protein